jgi:hypothetical protein
MDRRKDGPQNRSWYGGEKKNPVFVKNQAPVLPLTSHITNSAIPDR